MEKQTGIIERLIFKASDLVASHPPYLKSANKKVVYEIACPPGAVHSGEINYSRWKAMDFPERIPMIKATDIVELRSGFFDYKPVSDDHKAAEWHVNFADPDLFIAYSSHLLAQDEMQVAEHPALAILKQQLNVMGSYASTVDGTEPTPVIIQGVERRCIVQTDPNAEEGRPRGLYGNLFGSAPADSIRSATSVITPPTITNLICIAAPSGGYGQYTNADIRYVLKTAYTGFMAAKLESNGAPVVIHSGFWGCGAFGGNRLLMTWLQTMAASMAGIQKLILHTGAPEDGTLKKGWAEIETVLGKEELSIDEMIQGLVEMGFQWGESDGN